jgi:hypothetical protein
LCFVHLEEALLVQEAPEFRDDPGPGAEDLSNVGVHGEVGVPLPIPGLGVREARVHGALAGLGIDFDLAEGRWSEGLGQERP